MFAALRLILIFTTGPVMRNFLKHLGSQQKQQDTVDRFNAQAVRMPRHICGNYRHCQSGHERRRSTII